MNREAPRILNQVQAAWQAATYGMRQMEQSSSVRPDNAYEVFRIDATGPADKVKLDVGPVVFNVPERANRGRADLFIVVKGWIVFEGDLVEKPYLTHTFGTEIGYFLQKAGNLEHVYGAHYDMDELKPGHPVFHAQVGAQLEFADAIRERYHLDLPVVPKMGSLLSNVRTPSAQMDVFAVMTQICADHLVGEAPAREVKTAFGDLRRASDFFVGAAHRLAYLNQAPAIGCYRSKYWYEAPAANAV